jgi:uncharacterized protein YyaL (SSP411 family)
MANRLARETSPYLRQHADNPVDWYPWGDEAFARARAEDRPVLLSVGYSSCHWCHVMAHESFEDPATARVMNDKFVNVKVDREERPDVDAVYMEAVQAMTGHGGWPMTVFLTPDGRPFFGGTYFPKTRRGNLPGFVELLERVDEVWRTRRAEVIEQAGQLTAALARTAALTPGDEPLGPEVLDAAVQALRRQFDPTWGGFGAAPKFPQATSLELLLRANARRADEGVLGMVTTSLDAMASGGIYDHLGGGFARYSVDERWLVPHFEKMLYDQALLARVYLHAWQVTGEPRYRQVLDETIGYVLADLRHPRGGFFSARDADSEGEEGRYYLWSLDEVRDALAPLGDDTVEAAVAWYGVTAEGNFEGRNILHRPQRGVLARPEPVERARRRLLEVRAGRVPPGLAEAASATGNPAWLDAAVAAGRFLLTELRAPDGRWLRSWQQDGGARQPAFAADHAALIDAFVRLAEATGRAHWIHEATDVATTLVERFWDDDRGGLFTTADDADPLVTRPKDLLDNASPSANSLAALGLLRLSALTGLRWPAERAEAILRLLAAPATRHPTAFTHLLAALDLYTAGPTEIAVVGDRPDLVEVVRTRYLPNAVLAWGEPFDSPLWTGRAEGLAYVCRDFTCRAPAGDPETLAAQLAA